MDSSVAYLISTLSLIFIVQESSILVLGDAGLIQSTCQKTRLSDLCTSTLNADPSSQEANMLGLANITVNVAKTRDTNISKYILDELVKSYTDANAVKVVTGCNSFSSATPPLAYPDGLAQRQRDFQNLCGVSTDIVQVIRNSNP
ncbi:pectinesterase inhibitor 28-like [Papaver somniferum]|uniref:pectinesterase inhibitor 28-like n=1 Tax=Papaver somniferum TaxID=3469 RepID=UPI000E6F5D3A|nr:pectinesterase inhibitor 28-like [Papaver somniferum]